MKIKQIPEQKLKKIIKRRLWLQKWSVTAQRALDFMKKYKNYDLSKFEFHETSDYNFFSRKNRLPFIDWRRIGASGKTVKYYKYIVLQK